jgi:hypothetical protein
VRKLSSSLIAAALALALVAALASPTTATAAKRQSVIACYHKKVRVFTAEVRPANCEIAGYRGEGKQFIAIPITGMKWTHWGPGRIQGAYGKTLGRYGDGTRRRAGVRIIIFGRTVCADGRAWYSKVNVVFPGVGNFFELRLPTCDGPDVVDRHRGF